MSPRVAAASSAGCSAGRYAGWCSGPWTPSWKRCPRTSRGSPTRPDPPLPGTPIGGTRASGGPERVPVVGAPARCTRCCAGPARAGRTKENAVLLDILGLIVIGLIIGALARLIKPGRQRMSVAVTLALGVVGAIIGGLI